MTVAIAVVIPTRNRDSLAIAAARSLVGQGVEIFVSDNSDAAGAVRAFCEAEDRIHYLRPPSVLAMADHWDWALRQAMAQSQATHFSVHYDRNVSKPGRWAELAAAAARRPDDLITFTHDNILFHPPPRRLWQVPWTGKLYAISSRRIAGLVASGQVHATAALLPLLSNCLVPREVLDRFAARFGSICRGAGPDSVFLARYLASNDRYLHFDCAIDILTASERSTGLGYLRRAGGDYADYRKTIGDGPWLPSAPVPGIDLGYNLLFHDYETVRRETGGRLPPVDRSAVLDALASDLRWVADPEERAELVRILRGQGWTGEEPEPFGTRSARWILYERMVLLCARWFGVVPGTVTGFAFRDDATALAHASKFPRPRQDEADHLALACPEELA
ncbi:MAG TPA: hypothetical protein VEW25_10580 [Allosphingosinicella sp.]|nr:hypothetical protein [Allosphingosinicella sp.]